ncbi:hypothetical protein LUZ62_050181 [Rhynchospora pubera]|uniref:Uncharacterized protein n=1 Tax=Rhynchospora pubera TaxID=906938 RepID=A0AAV8FZP4_9POAL|nr:hypothetical protein LUZ62_082509 [Rhynchospora pubera]KAJ4798935.1 hypothetical protein LUZ62_050181 [Rhynchospora pubera]
MESQSDSDAPEELTVGEGIRQHEEIRKAQRDHVVRVAKEGKERRRQRAQTRALAKSEKEKNEAKRKKISGDDQLEQEREEENRVVPGMLPKDIVDILAAREKQTFASDSEEEIDDQKGAAQKKKNKKRHENKGPETVILSDMPPPQCLTSSIDFLNRRKMSTPRSTSVLKNADRALRLLSTKGGLLSKR